MGKTVSVPSKETLKGEPKLCKIVIKYCSRRRIETFQKSGAIPLLLICFLFCMGIACVPYKWLILYNFLILIILKCMKKGNVHDTTWNEIMASVNCDDIF